VGTSQRLSIIKICGNNVGVMMNVLTVMYKNIIKFGIWKERYLSMSLTAIKLRLWGGYYYERIKYLKQYASKDDKILQAYLEYAKYSYWHGGKNCLSNSYFPEDSEKVSFDDIIIPSLTGNSVGTFWYEFPDVLLPYLLEKRGKKYAFTEIAPLMTEGPYELNDNVSVITDDVVIDCGANIGLFSAIAAKKGGNVYAFEPDKNVISNYLSQTAEYNGNIEVCPYALSDYVGTGYFNPNLIDIGGGRLGKKSESSVAVETITLDQFVVNRGISRVNYIKSDIEGAERDMLRGATKVLKEFAPKLSICTYHLPDDKKVLEQIVLEANSRYNIKHDYLKMYCWVEKE